MNKGILFFLLAFSVSANAQSLKDALYGGKLKSDTGTIVRKSDDLSTKIDTGRRKQAEPEKAKPVPVAKDKPAENPVTPAESQVVVAPPKNDNNAAVKDNTKLWKEYMDSMTLILKEEVLSSKKIKNGTYYILVDYEIGIDGQVTINNIYPSPENSFLASQVKEKLSLSAPVLTPVMGVNGKPRKVIKKYNFPITKG